MKKIEFYTARYCGKCRALKRRINDLSDELKAIEIEFVDIDICKVKVKKNNVDGFPTLILYIDGLEEKRVSGSIYEEDLLNFIA
jgi:thiol-disulfide isomerase/thioredoxin